MTPRELAAAIRKGHTMIGETSAMYLSNAGCGCAIGAALVASGHTKQSWDEAKGSLYGDWDGEVLAAKLLGADSELLKDVSHKHHNGMPRLAIADWLDTLDVSKPKDKQTFDDFMKAALVEVEFA